MGVSLVGLDYALEGRVLEYQKKIEPAVPRGASGSWTQRKSFKEKIFVSG